MRFLHQIAKPEEKERKEFERERSIPEEEIYEFSNFVKRIRPYTGEYVSYTVERSGVSIHEVIEELKKVVKNKKGVKKVSISGEPSYILRSFVDFDVGREFPASIEMWCASSDFCTTETDLPFLIPAKRAMKMNKDQIEMSLPFLPKECHVDDVHIHENEMHVHIVCLSTTAELPFILDELMSIGRKKL